MKRQTVTTGLKGLICSALVTIAIFGTSRADTPPLPQWPTGEPGQATSMDAASAYIQQVVEQEKETIDRELQRHVNPKTTTYADIAKRWKELPQQLVKAGMTPEEAKSVVRDARNNVTVKRPSMPYRHWPVLAKRGAVKGEPVWVVILAWPKSASSPSKTDGNNWYRQVMLISPRQPYSVFSTSNLMLQE